MGKTTLKTESLTILLYSPYWRKWGAPHFRHSRSTHLYQMGIPLSYIKDFLGHSSINTTSIYASTDITMMKSALEGASKKDATGNIEIPVWQGDEDMILSLCGLK